MLLKHPSADLKISYPIIVETGIILALLLLIICTHLRLPENSANNVFYVESEEIALVLPPAVSETKIMKPPPVPTVPVKIPNDSPIEPPPIEMNEFDRVSRLMIPPLPNELKIEVDFDLLKGIELLPELIGGEDAFRQSIEYPKLARLAGIEGIVEVEFTVNESGKVLNPEIIKGIGGGCDEAVLKALKLQRYKPGKKGGNTSSFKIKETVQFILLDT